MPRQISPIPPPRPELQQFNAALDQLLKPENPPARSLLAFIRRTLRQYGLEGSFSEIDIFVIAYLRGVELLLGSSGKSIRNPRAWMRGTTLNVIREQSRERKKRQPLLTEVVDRAAVPQLDEEHVDENLSAVMQAFECLSHDERKLIELKHLRGSSWQAVREKLGEQGTTLPALRKRGQRALQKLRREYHKIKPPLDRD